MKYNVYLSKTNATGRTYYQLEAIDIRPGPSQLFLLLHSTSAVLSQGWSNYLRRHIVFWVAIQTIVAQMSEQDY